MSKEDDKKALYEMVGAIKAAKMFGSFVDAARYSLYKQIKDTKAYELLGKDWKDFCIEDLGRDQKTVNQEIKFLEEYGESFLTAATNMRLTKRDLNALGSGLSDDAKAGIKKGVIKIGDFEIKETEIADHVDELKDAIEAVAKAHEESRAQLKANQRIVDDMRKNNEKLHKSLERLEKREAHLSENPEAFEADYIKTLDGFRIGFDKFMDRIDPESDGIREIFNDNDEDGKKKKFKSTAKMAAHYLATLDYMKKRVLAASGTAADTYGTAAMLSEQPFEPGKE